MKKSVVVILLIVGSWLNLSSQPRRMPHNDSFTRQYIHRYYTPSRELFIFNRSWDRLIHTYMVTASFSNRLNNISKFDIPTQNPDVLLSEYYKKIDDLNANFEAQQAANNYQIDMAIRGLGEIAADIARQNNITTKSALGDFLIKEVIIGSVQERAKEKNRENLELQRKQLQENLEANLRREMSSIRDQLLSETSQYRDKYLEAMAFEADFSKESYYASCYNYYDCYSKQIISEYSYNSSGWYKPRCKSPGIAYNTNINSNDYVSIAFRKLELYKKYGKDIFMNGVNLYLDAALAENRQNPKAFFLKAQLEKDIIEKMFFASLASTLDPQNYEYRQLSKTISDSFNEDFFTAIRNGNINFISRSIEKGFNLGREKDGRSAIEMAIDYDRAEILEILVNSVFEEKKNISQYGAGLLFHACAVDALETAKKLVNMGINPEFADKSLSGLTALNIAVENNSRKTITYLATNFSIKSALIFTKKNDSENLDQISLCIYETAPDKLRDIISVNPQFSKKYLAGKTGETSYNSAYSVAGSNEGNNNNFEYRSDNSATNSGNESINKNTRYIERSSGTTESSNLYSSADMTNRIDIKERESDEAFLTADFGTFTDSRDGHSYGWIKINNQIWMSENLAYNPYASGSAWIYGIENIDEWNNSANYGKYGVLYNYQTALKSCPAGWRIPTDYEWSKLENYLDNTVIDFNQMSYRGTTIGSKLTMTKAGSFNARFGGKRLSSGKFVEIDNTGSYWTSTKAEGTKAWNRQIQRNLPQIIRSKADMKEGNSVRCVKKD